MTELKSGDRFGRLVVIERAPDYVTARGKKYPRYLCKCDCGNIKEIGKYNLTNGFTQSCGCLHKERTIATSQTHGDTDSRLYNVWCAMKRRCYNQTVPEYKRYGARGIAMCDEWKNNYDSFKAWAIQNGYDKNAKRGDCTIDRIDNDKGYCPDNCRWVTTKVQMNNVSTNHIEELNGEIHTLSEWADKYGISASKLRSRLQLGWGFEKALLTP